MPPHELVRPDPTDLLGMPAPCPHHHFSRPREPSPQAAEPPFPPPPPVDGSLGIVTELVPRASLFHLLHPAGAVAGSPPAVPLAWRLLHGAASGMVCAAHASA